MPLRLRVIPRTDEKAGEGAPPTTERIVELEDKLDEIRIGRRPDLELSLPFKALSTLHARLVRQKPAGIERSQTWLVEDLDSKNGTLVGKSRLKAGEQRLLFTGDKVDLGPVKVVFDGYAAPMSGAEGTATIARRLVNDLLAGSPGATAPTLTVISDAADAQTLKLLDRDRPYFIGRAKTCDLCFPADELSRQHASLTRTWNGIVIRDLGSKNGVQVNGVSVINQRLSDGDVIEMGPLKLHLMDPEDKYLRDLDNPERLERSPKGEPVEKPKAAGISMPAGLAVSLPTPMAPPVSTVGPDGAPRPASRLAPRPSAAPAPERHAVLDVHHPAIFARRPPADPQPQAGDEQTQVRRARKTMVFAVAVLAVIAAVALVLVLGDFLPSERLDR